MNYQAIILRQESVFSRALCDLAKSNFMMLAKLFYKGKYDYFIRTILCKRVFTFIFSRSLF
jgi:hypothetical protein